jgi:hypothetical protein
MRCDQTGGAPDASDCAPIALATGNNYRLRADSGFRIRFRVRGDERRRIDVRGLERHGPRPACTRERSYADEHGPPDDHWRCAGRRVADRDRRHVDREPDVVRIPVAAL